MKRITLRKANPDNLIRLAMWLKLDVDGMSHRQIASLIHWRITREDKRRRGLTNTWY
jgi:hypothetical protein